MTLRPRHGYSLQDRVVVTIKCLFREGTLFRLEEEDLYMFGLPLEATLL